MSKLRWLGPLVLVVGLIALFFPWDLIDGTQVGIFIIDINKYSAFGEFIGGIMSLTAVALIYMTYNAQKSELDETRKVLSKQAFEMTFFNMLSELNGIIELMFGRINNKKASKRNYMFEVFKKYKALCLVQMNQVNNEHEAGKLIHKSIVNSQYEDFIYDEHQQNLSHYFRYVYNILKFIRVNSQENTDVIKDLHYVSLLQARVSNAEMGLLFYNSISDHARTSDGAYRFREWLDYYGFFENIDPKFLVIEDHAEKFYPKTKFKFRCNY
ncbi:Putative phage abortive infection protein [Reichenbachiella faecimaris]|uniref:Putative phage abortive infection protein n=1 Tax=Reichenbachiella faecimaris TaxID=692418 RepID=A0A1W2GHD7_REIFA|nr:putative phage abortive infection protein [Reichenbachiella faecimaris]SMD36069.1 Putative phage abortive infection protein [Reichenbachiella faecimaris]